MSLLILKEKVLDIKITKFANHYELYVPIKTGCLTFRVVNADLQVIEFLETVLNTEVRRFGENPSKQ